MHKRSVVFGGSLPVASIITPIGYEQEAQGLGKIPQSKLVTGSGRNNI